MIFVISSAKSLNTDLNKKLPANYPNNTEYSYFHKQHEKIKTLLASLTIEQIKTYMKISDKLAALNYDRFQNFDNAPKYIALFLYHGDVYKNLKLAELNLDDINFLQTHLRIISGLYGLIRPLDKILIYRLEISTKFSKIFSNIAAYWSDHVTQRINYELLLHDEKFLVNLASKEYFSVINVNKLQFPVLNLEFRQKTNSQLKNIGLYTKKARGLMLNYIAKNKINSLEQIKDFSADGYSFAKEFSNDKHLFFVKTIS